MLVLVMHWAVMRLAYFKKWDAGVSHTAGEKRFWTSQMTLNGADLSSKNGL